MASSAASDGEAVAAGSSSTAAPTMPRVRATLPSTDGPKIPSSVPSPFAWSTCHPLTGTEYYILDSYSELAPNEPWTKKGNFTIDGEGIFTIYTSQRVNKPSIEGTRTFMQYWSVRTEKRVGGTISTQKHFNEWKKHNMNLGNHDYVVLAVEGYTATGGSGSSGSSTLNLS